MQRVEGCDLGHLPSAPVHPHLRGVQSPAPPPVAAALSCLGASSNPPSAAPETATSAPREHLSNIPVRIQTSPCWSPALAPGLSRQERRIMQSFRGRRQQIPQPAPGLPRRGKNPQPPAAALPRVHGRTTDVTARTASGQSRHHTLFQYTHASPSRIVD